MLEQPPDFNPPPWMERVFPGLLALLGYNTDMATMMANLQGDGANIGVDKHPGVSAVIKFLGELQAVVSQGASRFPARIVDAAVFAGNPNRWKYGWTEIELDTDGTTGVDKSGGATGTTSSNFAINLYELYNPSFAGKMCNGVDTSDTEATITLLPVPYTLAGARAMAVEMFYMNVREQEAPVPVFTFPNPISLDCPSS